jgi:uncharacterized protein (TIGR00251 family)
MPSRDFHLHDSRSGAALAVRVIPRAKQNQIVEISSDGTVKIRLTAPPVGGKANRALIELLAGVLDVPAARIEIIAGETGRNKLVSILDLDAQTVQERIKSKIT